MQMLANTKYTEIKTMDLRMTTQTLLSNDQKTIVKLHMYVSCREKHTHQKNN